jgi:hypothetical protein
VSSEKVTFPSFLEGNNHFVSYSSLSLSFEKGLVYAQVIGREASPSGHHLRGEEEDILLR